MGKNVRIEKGLVAFFLVLAALPVFAGSSATEIVRKAQQKIDRAKSLSADFSTTTQLSVIGKKSTISGRLFVLYGQNKIRLEQPEQTIVSDGKSVWTFAVANRQVVVTHAERDGIGARPDELLRYADRYIPVLIGQETLDGQVCHVLKLTAKNPHLSPSELQVWVDATAFLTRKMAFRDEAGSETVIRFSAIRLDASLPPDIFRMTVPKDVELVDLR
ncbi:MAG: outer membrane lipoprotein carrier protein LolA [candidate division Zixibacteria bacterium]|nr:outer membrane lipoprotein carrier protein LolA [candidate division Zixibacteria bacterium]